MIVPAEWVPADITLEPNALSAAKESHNSQVLTAGPGAGKTEVLAQRADFLLMTGVSPFPKRILAISFKVDASTNLKARVRLRCGNLSSRFDSYTFHAFAKRIIDQFRLVLTGLDALDPNYTIGKERIGNHQIRFKDLIPIATQILKESEIALKAVRESFSDVFLDEFQDCTDDQYEFFKTAFIGTQVRVTAVGDVKQRIMGWAGALDGIFAQYQQDFNAVQRVLFSNFRSLPQILKVQSSIIQHMDPASALTEDMIQGEGGFVSIEEFDSSCDEAQFVIDTIQDLVVEGIPKSEIAILVRSQIESYTFELQELLERNGIPYRNEQDLQDIATQPLARLIVDYLLVVTSNKQPKSWERLMDVVSPFSTLERQELDQSVWLSKLKKDRQVLSIIGLEGLDLDDVAPYVQSFMELLGSTTIKALSPEYETDVRIAEVFSDTFKYLEKLYDRTENLFEALGLFFDDDSVRILTVHKSKGLEFDSVILLGIENETYWGNDAEENLSTFFVGISRAKRRLILTVASNRTRSESHAGVWVANRNPKNDYLDFVRPYVNL